MKGTHPFGFFILARAPAYPANTKGRVPFISGAATADGSR
jgi:hypothetical protein